MSQSLQNVISTANEQVQVRGGLVGYFNEDGAQAVYAIEVGPGFVEAMKATNLMELRSAIQEVLVDALVAEMLK